MSDTPTLPVNNDLTGIPFSVINCTPAQWQDLQSQIPSDWDLYSNFAYLDPDTGNICSVGAMIDDDELEWLYDHGFTVNARSYRKSNQPGVWQY